MGKKLTKETEHPERIIFLDFDGVLSTDLHDLKFIDSKMNLLDKIIKQTDAYIVLSTAHRRYKKSLRKFDEAVKKLGWDNNRIVGITPDFKDHICNCIEDHEIKRTREIKSYITKHKITLWVAIDDITLRLKHFVETNYLKGLNEENVNDIISILMRYSKEKTMTQKPHDKITFKTKPSLILDTTHKTCKQRYVDCLT